jgi:hypothetical protein
MPVDWQIKRVISRLLRTIWAGIKQEKRSEREDREVLMGY